MAEKTTVRWGFIDAVVSAFSPSLAGRRYAARISIENMRRSYDSASKGRGTAGWSTGGSSADAEIAAAGGILRERMRDLVRNDPLAAQAVQVLVNNIVGPGIRPRAKTSNKRLNKKIDALWAEFSRTCDWHGRTDVYGMQALAVREMVEGGEVLAIQRYTRKTTGNMVPLKIELREGDHLDDFKRSDGANGARISQGIEYGDDGQRTAYWMFPDHPGGTHIGYSRRYVSERVSADKVAHLFERQRVQNRGVPWGVAAMRGLRDFGDWHRAELVRKKTEACMVGIVVADDSNGQSVAPSVKGSDGKTIETFEPGMIAYANNAKEVHFNQPAATANVQEWSRVQMLTIAAGFRVPYALMTGDLSLANFSSNRAGLNEFRRMVDQLQWHCVIPMFCQPTWDWFILAAQTAGQLPVDLGQVPVEWAPPRFESVNPLQDVNADMLEVRAGFATRSQKIAQRGYDPVEVLDEWTADAEAADAANLIFDSDPRKVSKGGNVQPDQQTTDTPPDGAVAKTE